MTTSRIYIGWQWRNFVPYLCQLVFADILWVKLLYHMLYPQNGDRVVTTVYVTSFHCTYIVSPAIFCPDNNNNNNNNNIKQIDRLCASICASTSARCGLLLQALRRIAVWDLLLTTANPPLNGRTDRRHTLAPAGEYDESISALSVVTAGAATREFDYLCICIACLYFTVLPQWRNK